MDPARTSLTRTRTRLATFGAAMAIVIGGILPTTALAAQVVPNRISVHPDRSLAVRTAAAHFTCQDRPIGSGRCYSPQQIRAAYGIQSLLDKGITGRKRTIVIIDAFSNPYVESDLAIFDQTFGLPDPVFNTIAPQGVPAFDFGNDDMTGWAGEITLDVQWSHAVAPKAKIVLVEAKSDNDADILAATKYAVDHNLGDVISQSFGEGEVCVDPKILAAQHRLFEKATRRGITLIASSGDDGATQPACDGSDAVFKDASSPASDPLVLGVGGTTLNADAAGAYGGEIAWSEGQDIGIPCLTADNDGCSGGGFSDTYRRPAYQFGIPGTHRSARGVPDVAYSAAVDGGVLTHDGVDLQLLGFDPTDPTLFFRFGGTSAGTPQWAGLTALASQLAGHRLGLLNDDVYRISRSKSRYAKSFHDITSGTNNFLGINGFDAAKGWDPVTGLGSPKAGVLVPLLSLGGH